MRCFTIKILSLKNWFFREFSGYRSKKAFKPPALPGGCLRGNVAFEENILRGNALFVGKRGLLRDPPAKPGAEISTLQLSPVATRDATNLEQISVKPEAFSAFPLQGMP